jgi:hypothetical protein
MKARILFAAFVSALSLALFADSDTIEGIVRSVDPDELRIVILTPSDEIVAVYGSEATPVRFEGSTYRISDLEVGDSIRMSLTGAGEARRVATIDVLASVSPSPRTAPRIEPREPRLERESAQEVLRADPGSSTTLTSVVGKVDQTRPSRNLIRIIAEGGLSWVRIDASNAQAPDGSPFDVSYLVFGETIEATGSIGSNGELVATTIRRESEIGTGYPAPVMIDDEPEAPEEEAAVSSMYTPRAIHWLDVVEFEGEIVTRLNGVQTLTIRNDITGNDDIVWCDSSLVAMMDDEEPLPASELEEGARVHVRALRVSEGLVAQSIRVSD